MTAARARTADRVAAAEKLLLQRRSPSQVVAELADSEGISRRSARRYVARALDAIKADTESVDRPQLVALLVDALNRSIAMGLERHQPAVVIGAARELDSLLGLGASHRQSPHTPMVRRWT
jgi:hypothetical protein